MGFFQKNVNVFLILLIIISVVGFVGMSVFYQNTFHNVTTSLDASSSDYSICVAKLDNVQNQLAKTVEVLNHTEQDIRKYDTLYANKTSELTSTRSTLQEKSSELTKYIGLHTEEKTRANSLTAEVTRLTTAKNELSSENNALRIQVGKLESDFDDLRDDYEECSEDLEVCLG